MDKLIICFKKEFYNRRRNIGTKIVCINNKFKKLNNNIFYEFFLILHSLNIVKTYFIFLISFNV